MFGIYYSFVFEDEIPKPSEILSLLKSRIRLPLKLNNYTIYIDHTNISIGLEYFSPSEDYIGKNQLNLEAYDIKITYVMGNLLICLYEMGGTKAEKDFYLELEEIPNWCYMSYEEASKHPDFIK